VNELLAQELIKQGRRPLPGLEADFKRNHAHGNRTGVRP
jgi:hypothetical protein